jgi:hypothetical protein
MLTMIFALDPVERWTGLDWGCWSGASIAEWSCLYMDYPYQV